MDSSQIANYDLSSSQDWLIDIYNRLLEEGVIKETETGAIFVKSYLFTASRINDTALSYTASLILGGNRNGWEIRKDSSGKPLNSNTKLKQVFKG